jgi:hypothetical protein
MNLNLQYFGRITWLISSDSKCEAQCDSSESGSSHIDDTALGEVTASETDTEGEKECNENFLWEDMGNYAEQ